MGGTRSSSAAWKGAVAEDSIKCTRAAIVLRGAARRGTTGLARPINSAGCAAQGTSGVRGSGHLGLGLEDDLALEEVLGVERRGALRVAGRVRVHLNQPYP